jgi:hypothetical protein
MARDAHQFGAIVDTGASRSGLNLGGIGTGGVELRPDGRLHNWTMLNCRPWASYEARHGTHTVAPPRPAAGDTDSLVRVARGEERPTYRRPFTGHGDMRATGQFLRQHKYFFLEVYESIEYRAHYPCVRLRHLDGATAVDLELTAWTPFIPRDVSNSSLPGAYLDFTVRNTARDAVAVSLVWQQQNLSGYGAERVRQRHQTLASGRASIVRMEGSLDEPDHDTNGCVTVWAVRGNGQRARAVAANPYMPNLVWPVDLTGSLDGPLLPGSIRHEGLNEGSSACEKGTVTAPSTRWMLTTTHPARSRCCPRSCARPSWTCTSPWRTPRTARPTTACQDRLRRWSPEARSGTTGRTAAASTSCSSIGLQVVRQHIAAELAATLCEAEMTVARKLRLRAGDRLAVGVRWQTQMPAPGNGRRGGCRAWRRS